MFAFTRALAIDEAPHGVRVNAVLTGNVETPLWVAVSGPRPIRVELTDRKRSGSAASERRRVGRLCLFLASDADLHHRRRSHHFGWSGTGLRAQDTRLTVARHDCECVAEREFGESRP